MAQITVRKLLAQRKNEEYEFLGETWYVRRVPIYEFQEVLAGLRESARDQAINSIGNAGELRKEPINEKEWNDLVKLSGGIENMTEAKPDNLYEQRLQTRTNSLLMVEMAIWLFRHGESNQSLKEIATDETELDQIREELSTDIALAAFIGRVISGRTKSEKNG